MMVILLFFIANARMCAEQQKYALIPAPVGAMNSIIFYDAGTAEAKAFPAFLIKPIAEPLSVRKGFRIPIAAYLLRLNLS